MCFLRGGVALILLPDRHRTRDRDRRPTALAHLVAEYEEGVSEVSDAHLVEWLEHRGMPLGATSEEQAHTLDRHRRRSIHVHCWDAPEFLEVILWGIENLDEQWEFVDGSLPSDEFPTGIEFGFVLRRSATAVDPVTRRRRFEAAWRVVERSSKPHRTRRGAAQAHMGVPKNTQGDRRPAPAETAHEEAGCRELRPCRPRHGFRQSRPGVRWPARVPVGPVRSAIFSSGAS